MIILDDVDIFDEMTIAHAPKGSVGVKPDYRKLQWIDVVPGLQTYIPVEIHDQPRDRADEGNEPEGE